jgi:hypothetical protein
VHVHLLGKPFITEDILSDEQTGIAVGGQREDQIDE